MGSIVANQPPAGLTDLPDRELLRRYLAGRDRSALEALVQRHGGMVLGVCRRMLGDPHDAEDAFQATFLVFVRKASTIRPDGLVGPWLYGVATRMAMKARALAARRRAREIPVGALPNVPAPAGPAVADWLPVLDREVARLPAKYRWPVLLCDLRGLSRGDAAQQLAIPIGTLSSRLARARETLRRRLSKRGVGVAALMAAALLPSTAPAALVEATVRSATAFAAGASLATPPAVLAAALLAGFRRDRLVMITAAVLAFVALVGGGTFLWLRGGGPAPVITAQATQQTLEGDWTVTTMTMDGAAVEPGALSVGRMQCRGNHLDWPFDSDYTTDSTSKPKQITLTCPVVPPPNNLVLGIYEINGDEMKLCISAPGQDRPTEFSAGPGTMRILATLKRQAPADR